MGTAQRYIAYSSDIGESFRPVSHPYLVRSAYAISWAYILGDVTIEGRKAFLAHQDYILRHSPHLKTVSEPHCDATVQPDTSEAAKRNDPGQLTPWPTAHVPLSQDWRSITAERAVFQVFASMALPAFTIHSIVKYSGRAVKDSKSVFMRTWAPIGVCEVYPSIHPSMPLEEISKLIITNRFCLIIVGPFNCSGSSLHL